jgi:hypothetical protein
MERGSDAVSEFAEASGPEREWKDVVEKLKSGSVPRKGGGNAWLWQLPIEVLSVLEGSGADPPGFAFGMKSRQKTCVRFLRP